MNNLHMISGLPRSGSTLLCNVLNQNPNFHATSTSPLPAFVFSMMQVAANNLEFKNLLEKQPELSQHRMDQSVRGFISAFHGIHDKDVVFDKNRAWLQHPYAVQRINPTSKIIVLVRDLRDVFASVVKQDRRNGLLGTTPLHAKVQHEFSPEGVIGPCINNVVNALDSRLNNVVFIRYEDLTADPAGVMADLHKVLGIEEFVYDFDNVQNTAIDCDGHYLHKFPHKGEGKVRPSRSEWHEYVPRDMAKQIVDSFPKYQNAFNYC